MTSLQAALVVFILVAMTSGQQKFYVDDGCKNSDNIVPSYQSENTYMAGVRCCWEDPTGVLVNGVNTKCKTTHKCEVDGQQQPGISYAEAIEHCAQNNCRRICTREEIEQSEVCCGTGGNCNWHAVWTSTPETGTYIYPNIGDGTTSSTNPGKCTMPGEICYPRNGCSPKCSKDATNGVAGDGDGSRGNCNAGEFCYPNSECSKKCSKYLSNGVAGNGDGSQGNCDIGEFCYSGAECSKICSEDPIDGAAGTGDGSQGNCDVGEFCYSGEECSKICSKDPIGGAAGTGDGSQGNCGVGEFCYAGAECSKKCSKDGINKLPPGDGTTQGNCPSNQICQTNGKCSEPQEEEAEVEEEEEEEEDIPPGAAAAVAIVAMAAIAPPPLAMFPPQGLPQPGGSGQVGGGGGALPAAVALQNPVLAAQISSLVTGINGAVALGVFSSTVPGTFAVPRTVPATAVLVAEPGISATSRQSAHPTAHRQQSCPRPIIPFGRKIKIAETKINPILDRFSKITTPISNVQSKISNTFSSIKVKILEKLGLQCLFPKLLRPFEPMFKYVQCLLGLNEDGFMEPPPCNRSACMNTDTEDRVITHDRGLPNIDLMIDGKVSTMDDCFDDMEKVVYGGRILAKLVDDESCDNPKYEKMCQDLINEDRMLLEENCETPGCVLPSDDPFTSCFGCESEITIKIVKQKRYDYTHHEFDNFIDRQSEEVFQATAQNLRVICVAGATGRRRCRLRIDRAMQLRGVSYGRALQFIQSEQYLGDDDVDVVYRRRKRRKRI